MRDPGAVEAVARLAPLVLLHLRERDRVHLGVAPRRDERRHAADRVRAARVAGLARAAAMYARMNGTVIVTCARSGSTAPIFLMQLKM